MSISEGGSSTSCTVGVGDIWLEITGSSGARLERMGLGSSELRRTGLGRVAADRMNGGGGC